MKFFSKVKEENIRHVFLGKHKLFSYKREEKKTSSQVIFEKLKNISINNNILSQPKNNYDNVIWQLWLQGLDDNNCPHIVKKCLGSVKEHCHNKERILLTLKNLDDFIKLPDFIKEKYERGVITRTHLSDYIRILLLSQYGGTWIDATCLLTENIPTIIDDTEFFIFKNQHWMNIVKAPDLEFFNFIQPTYGDCFHIGSSWFIHAKANCQIINDTLSMLNNYWQNNEQLLDYFLLHYLMTIVILSSPINRDLYDKMPSYSNIPPHILQYNLLRKYNNSFFSNIKRQSFIHKLTYKNLKSHQADTFLKHILCDTTSLL